MSVSSSLDRSFCLVSLLMRRLRSSIVGMSSSSLEPSLSCCLCRTTFLSGVVSSSSDDDSSKAKVLTALRNHKSKQYTVFEM